MNITGILENIAWNWLRFRNWPRPFERIALAGRNDLIGVEVGVLYGEHAINILKHASIRKLFLVDEYRAYADYDQELLNRAVRISEKKLRPYAENIGWVYCPSARAASIVQGQLDFVYLDAGHDYESVSADIRAWWPQIKTGGILGGHDFANGFRRAPPGKPDNYGVIQAVIEFCVRERLKLNVERSDWWVIKP